MMNDEARQIFGLPLGDWLASFTSPKYLPMGIALYLAMFSVTKFVLLVFAATDTLDRAAFELTPAFLANLPDLQLVFLASIVTGTEAVLQYRTDVRSRYLGMGLGGLMAAGLVLGLYNAGTDPTGSNPGRLVDLGLVLGIVVLDHFSILAASETALRTSAEVAMPQHADIDADIEVALAVLEAAESAAESEPIETEIAELEALAEEAVAEAREEETEEEVEQDAEFALKDLDAFETWLDSASENREEPDKTGGRTGKAEEKAGEGKRRRGRSKDKK